MLPLITSSKLIDSPGSCSYYMLITVPLYIDNADFEPCSIYMLPAALITNCTDSGPCNDYMLPLIGNNADSELCIDYLLPLITNSAVWTVQ